MFSFEVLRKNMLEAKLIVSKEVLDILKSICEEEDLINCDTDGKALSGVLKGMFPGKDPDEIDSVVAKAKVRRVVVPYDVVVKVHRRGYVFTAETATPGEIRKKAIDSIVSTGGADLFEGEIQDIEEGDIVDIDFDYDNSFDA